MQLKPFSIFNIAEMFLFFQANTVLEHVHVQCTYARISKIDSNLTAIFNLG